MYHSRPICHDWVVSKRRGIIKNTSTTSVWSIPSIGTHLATCPWSVHTSNGVHQLRWLIAIHADRYCLYNRFPFSVCVWCVHTYIYLTVRCAHLFVWWRHYCRYVLALTCRVPAKKSCSREKEPYPTLYYEQKHKETANKGQSFTITFSSWCNGE